MSDDENQILNPESFEPGPVEGLTPQQQERLLALVQDILQNTQATVKKALQLIGDKTVDTQTLMQNLERVKDASVGFVEPSAEGPERVIEGVFNGDRMVGPDGKEYSVAPNYASKSKLVEGDMLKLTITGNGSFIYKQIGPIARRQLVAGLAKDERTGGWYALIDEKRWKLLTASVTYFHGKLGDQVVILVPEDGESHWAAVENIIHA